MPKAKNKSSVRTMKDSKRAPARRTKGSAGKSVKGNISKRGRKAY